MRVVTVSECAISFTSKGPSSEISRETLEVCSVLGDEKRGENFLEMGEMIDKAFAEDDRLTAEKSIWLPWPISRFNWWWSNLCVSHLVCGLELGEENLGEKGSLSRSVSIAFKSIFAFFEGLPPVQNHLCSLKCEKQSPQDLTCLVSPRHFTTRPVEEEHSALKKWPQASHLIWHALVGLDEDDILNRM